jgi:hypothetical protein
MISSIFAAMAASSASVFTYRTKLVPNFSLHRSMTAPKSAITSVKSARTMRSTSGKTRR